MDLSDRTLRLENITVRAPERDAPAVGGISFEAQPGRVTALFGPDAKSASTLLMIALGLVKPERGQVTVGGADLDDLDPSAWWARVAWVPQRPALVAGTIAENIRLGWSATEAEVAEAAAAAGLDETLDTVVLEDGLADDERQRVGLARVFLRDSAVVLLDEPTAALDADGERTLAALRRLVAGRTVVMAANRPALLPLADVVVAIPALVPA